MPLLDNLDEAIQTGNCDLTSSLTREALEESLDPKAILGCMVGRWMSWDSDFNADKLTSRKCCLHLGP